MSIIATIVLAAQTALFPQPVHLTRQITDPFAAAPIVVEQFCYGNRVVTIRGARTTIADYERNELTEIDRDAATYSITSFEDVAKATAGPHTAATKATPKKKNWTVRAKAQRASRLGRNADVYELSREDVMETETIEVSVDRSVELSPAAAEVVLGIAYPANKHADAEAVMNVARKKRDAVGTDSTSSSDTVALPVEQITRIDVEGERLEMRDLVVHIDAALPEPALLAIPPNAKRIESRLTQRTRVLEELDRVK